MPRGGKRSGAGRPKDSPTKRTRAVAEAAAAQGITPLEVMLETMRGHYAKGELAEACKIARDAAPYMHPRLVASKLEHSGPNGSDIPFGMRFVLVTNERADQPGA